MQRESPPRSDGARDRRREMEALIRREGEIEVARLVARFRVSDTTIRKDLRLLEDQRRVVRMRGRVTRNGLDQPERPFEIRLHAHRAEKEAIADEAVGLVHDGETIALDASTTAWYLARALQQQRGWTGLRVLTNGLRAAFELAGAPGIEVIMTAGRLRRDSLSVVRAGAESLRVSVAAAFVSAVGLDLDSGLYEGTEDEANRKWEMVGAARQVVAMADSSKLGRRGAALFCPLTAVSLVVTDGGVAPSFVARLERMDIPLLIAYSAADEPSRSSRSQGSIRAHHR